MQLDGLRRRQTMDGAHLCQIRTELFAIANRNFDKPWLRKFYLFNTLETSPSNRLLFVAPQPQSIEFDQQRAIRRMKIADTRNGLQLEQPQQLPDLLMGLERNFLTEVNQQRLIARPLESAPFAVRS